MCTKQKVWREEKRKKVCDERQKKTASRLDGSETAARVRIA